MIKSILGIIVCLLIAAVGITVLAGGDVLAADYGLSFVKNKGLVESSLATVIGRVIGAVLGLVGVLLLVMMIYGGILYMSSGGNEDQISTAKKVLSYAVLGIIIVSLAFLLTYYIVNVLFSSNSSSSSGSPTGGRELPMS